MNLDNGCSYKLEDVIFIIGCHPYSSTLRIDSKRELLGGNEQHVVVDLCWFSLENTKQVGRVDKDDSYKDDNFGDKDIHLGMDGKLLTKKVASLYFFYCEECSSDFFLEKRAKLINFFFNVVCLAKESNLTRRSNRKCKNLMEILSDLNVLIVTYNKLKSNLGNIMGMGLDNENTKKY